MTTSNAATNNSVDRFLNGAKALAKVVGKAAGADDALVAQRGEIQKLRDQVGAALNGEGDFDAATKGFKAANNKLDKMIDARDMMFSSARDGVKALREALDALTADLDSLEARA